MRDALKNSQTRRWVHSSNRWRSLGRWILMVVPTYGHHRRVESHGERGCPISTLAKDIECLGIFLGKYCISAHFCTKFLYIHIEVLSNIIYLLTILSLMDGARHPDPARDLQACIVLLLYGKVRVLVLAMSFL